MLVLLAHNGPAGLGGAPHSICGCDWLATAGDHGDPDLQAVLVWLQAAGRQVALVLHGHMHHMIKGEGHVNSPSACRSCRGYLGYLYQTETFCSCCFGCCTQCCT